MCELYNGNLCVTSNGIRSNDKASNSSGIYWHREARYLGLCYIIILQIEMFAFKQNDGSLKIMIRRTFFFLNIHVYI